MQDSEHKMTEVVERICPYCQHRITQGERMVQCSQCGVPHHEECWQENQGCTVYGCKGWALWPGLNLPQREHRTFEPVDLTQLSSREFVLACPVCKSRVTRGMSQCRICGYELPRWMIGRYIIEVPWWGLMILGLLLLDAIAFGIAYYLEWETQIYFFAAPVVLAVIAFAVTVFRIANGPWWYRTAAAASGGILLVAAWLFRRLSSRFRSSRASAAETEPATASEASGMQDTADLHADVDLKEGRARLRWLRWTAAALCVMAVCGIAYGILAYLGVL